MRHRLPLMSWMVILLFLVFIPVSGGAFAQQRGANKGGGPPRGRPPRVDKGPKVGNMAPTFKLMSLDGKEETDLEKFRGKKPVVLLFGSYS